MNNKQQHYLWELAYKWSRGQLNAAEKKKLNTWEKDHDDTRVDNFSEATDEVKRRIFDAIVEKAELTPTNKINKDRSFGRSVWLKLSAVAAVVLMVCGIGWYAYVSQADLPTAGTAVASAALELSSGEIIDLASLKSGQQVNAEGVHLEKNSQGELVFKQNGVKDSVADLVHTLRTRSGQSLVVNLLDGSKVWLNANSNLSFNSNFLHGDVRSISLEGEAYFEVASLAGKKFIVHSGAQQLTVKGTHFNVRSYRDERSTTTTLLEGAVELALINDGRVLSTMALTPGTQALLKDDRFQKSKVTNANSTSWINGLYTFEEETVSSLAMKLEKWYGVQLEIQEEDVANLRLTGAIPLSYTIEEALRVLQLTGEVKSIKLMNDKYRIVTVNPK